MKHVPTYVGFEVLTAVVIKSTIFWDITSCSALSINRRFGGTYQLHLLLRWFLSQLIFIPWRWRRCVPPKRRLTLNGLHGVIYRGNSNYKERCVALVSRKSLDIIHHAGFIQVSEGCSDRAEIRGGRGSNISAGHRFVRTRHRNVASSLRNSGNGLCQGIKVNCDTRSAKGMYWIKSRISNWKKFKNLAASKR
jgi:hypothetical protein